MFPSHKDACKVLNDTISRTKLDDKKYDILSDDENNDKSSQNLLGHRPEKSDLSNLKEMKESDKFSSIRPAPLNLKSLNTNLSKNSMGGENIAEIKGRKRHEEQRHITIGFENIVYSSSRQLSLSRGKYLFNESVPISLYYSRLSYCFFLLLVRMHECNNVKRNENSNHIFS